MKIMNRNLKVGMIYLDNMKKKNGAVAVVESIFLHTSKINKSINLNNIYLPSGKKNKKEIILNIEKRSKIKKSIRNRSLKLLLKKIVVKSGILSFIYTLYKFFHPAKKAVDKYINNQEYNDIVMINDIYSMYAFVNKNINSKAITLFTSHTDGSIFNMLYNNFPKLKKWPIKKYFDKVESTVLKNLDYINFVSLKSYNNFVSQYPNLIDKTSYIYNGIISEIPDEKMKTINDDSIIRMISVGSVSYRKGYDLLIKSLAKINYSNLKLDIIGDGPNYEEYQNLVRKLNLNNVIKFLGRKENVIELLKNYDCFILTSRDEGLPIAIIEAMSKGLPILATDVGGVSELIRENGYLMQPNIENITSTLNKFLKDRDKIKNMSDNSKILFKEKFSFNSMIKNYSDLIMKITEGEK